MKNVRMLLLPVALISVSLFANDDRQERVERIARALHFGADHCEIIWQPESAIEVAIEDCKDATIPEILSAFDSRCAGKKATSSARSKKCISCYQYAARVEFYKAMFVDIQSLPETHGLTYKEIQEKAQKNPDFGKKIKDLMEPFER